MGRKILVFLGPPIILRRNPVCDWPGYSPFCQPFINPVFGGHPGFCCGGNGYGFNLAAAQAQGLCHPQAQMVNLTLPRNFQFNNCGVKNVNCRRC